MCVPTCPCECARKNPTSPVSLPTPSRGPHPRTRIHRLGSRAGSQAVTRTPPQSIEPAPVVAVAVSSASRPRTKMPVGANLVWHRFLCHPLAYIVVSECIYVDHVMFFPWRLLSSPHPHALSLTRLSVHRPRTHELSM